LIRTKARLIARSSTFKRSLGHVLAYILKMNAIVARAKNGAVEQRYLPDCDAFGSRPAAMPVVVSRAKIMSKWTRPKQKIFALKSKR
jgi:hypothetical protein